MDDRAVSTVSQALAETSWLSVPCPPEYLPALARDVLYALEKAGMPVVDGLTEEWAHMGQPHPDEDPEIDEWSCGCEIITPTRAGVIHEGFDTPVRRLVTPWAAVAASPERP